MKYIFYLGLILSMGCKSSNELKTRTISNSSFDYLEIDESFEMEVSDFYKNTAHCGIEGLPYALIIGKPISTDLPTKISVLSYCDNRIFKKGDKLKIEPTESPTKKTELNPVHFTKDTVINGYIGKWIIGSEHKALWGRPTTTD